MRYAHLFQRLDVEYVDVVFHQDLGQLATPMTKSSTKVNLPR